LLVKCVSKQRVIKYINHLILPVRIAAKPLEQLDKKQMGYNEDKHEYPEEVRCIKTTLKKKGACLASAVACGIKRAKGETSL
jgi:hypothetical protein